MKNLISTLVLSSMIAVSAKADHRLSDLRIRSYDNRPVIVSFNQVQYNTPGTWVNINDVRPGRHFIKVWSAATPRAYGYGRQLMYSGFIDVPSGAEVRAMVTKSFNIRINQVIPFAPEPVFDPYEPYQQYQQGPGHCGTPPAPMCMHEESFRELVCTIDHQSFESTKMQIAKQAIRQHGVISTDQVSELMRLMTFESSKLELAKFAYQYTVDQGHYFRLFNEFTFDSSVRELSNFIG
ncbi:MAG: DUF4476 domain-containing protein [Bacteroidia bacterium]